MHSIVCVFFVKTYCKKTALKQGKYMVCVVPNEGKENWSVVPNDGRESMRT